MIPRSPATTILSACLITFVSASVGQTTFYVNGTCGDDAWTGRSPICAAPDGPKRRIQLGIYASTSGDTVIVADGTYTGPLNKNLYLQGKAITVRSENGSERCIIDCEGLGRGFDIDQGERRDSVIDGFTICNGRVFDNGGAIRCENAGPTITNCTITNNAAGYHAGGIYCLNGDIAVIDCTIANNEAVDNGAGISLWGGRDVVVRGCTITANVAGGRGGGIDFSQCFPIAITDCTVTENEAQGSRGGGGIYGHLSTDVTITGSTIANNTADASGGGIEIATSFNVRITDVAVTGNSSARQGGGGIMCREGVSVAIAGCTITNNQAGLGRGGGISLRHSSAVTIADCTIRGNAAIPHGSGGGIGSYQSSATIIDTDITGNSASHGTGGGIVIAGDSMNPLDVLLSHCTIASNTLEHGWGGGVRMSSARLVIEDCTIADNTADQGGGVFSGIRGDIRIARSTITRNDATTSSLPSNFEIGGGGIYLFNNTHASIVDCVISQNIATMYGGGFLCYESNDVTITGCTIVNNQSRRVFGGGIESYVGSVLVSNNILWANRPDQVFVASGDTVVRYSDVQGDWPGEGNINLEPRLTIDGSHLSPDSPCIDAGDPQYEPLPSETDIDGQMRVWNGAVDMGCDEFGSFVFGDLNCDGAFNGADIDPFFLALGDPAGYAAQFPNCDPLLGDMNADGRLGGGDIDPFFACLGGGVCP